MAVSGPVDVSQIRDFANRVGAIPQELKDAAFGTIDKTVAEFEKRLKVSTPVSEKAPHLRDSIETFDGEPQVHERGIRIGDDQLIYAMSLEFGHRAPDGSHVPANPFFVPVNRVMRKKHRGSMRRALRKALKSIT